MKNSQQIPQLSRERLRIFLAYWRWRQGCLLSPLLFSIILQVSATTIRKQKEIKCIWIGKEVIKLLLFADEMLYIETLKDSIKILWDLINAFSTVTRYKIDVQKSVAFLILIIKEHKEKLKKIPLTITAKINKIQKNEPNQRCLYNENYKTLMKEIEDGTKKWKDVPSSRIFKHC